MRILMALVLGLALAMPAMAGDRGCGSGCGGKSKSKSGCCGYACKTKCPLAEDANACRSFGTEAAATSKVLQEDAGSAVEDNLSRI